MDNSNVELNQPNNNSVVSIFDALCDVEDVDEALDNARSRTVRLAKDREARNDKAARAYKQAQLSTSDIVNLLLIGKA